VHRPEQEHAGLPGTVSGSRNTTMYDYKRLKENLLIYFCQAAENNYCVLTLVTSEQKKIKLLIEYKNIYGTTFVQTIAMSTMLYEASKHADKLHKRNIGGFINNDFNTGRT
jgi:hypothetical protein